MRYKKTGQSKYHGVSKVTCKDNRPWMMSVTINGLHSTKRYTTEKDAAKAADLVWLMNGMDGKNFYTKRL